MVLKKRMKRAAVLTLSAVMAAAAGMPAGASDGEIAEVQMMDSEDDQVVTLENDAGQTLSAEDGQVQEVNLEDAQAEVVSLEDAQAELVDPVEVQPETAEPAQVSGEEGVAGLAQAMNGDEPIEEAIMVEAEDAHLTAASTTPLTGQFFSDQWGNGAADLDVRALVHGYNLIRWNAAEGMFQIDQSVVSGSAVSESKEGDESFHISLYQDLQFSDGTPVTAENYVFSLLLRLYPAMKELGADTGKLDYLKGAQAFMNGSTDVLAGVRLTGRYEFTVTIDHEYLPFFYELGLLDIVPWPIHVIAPGFRVKDDGQGVHFVEDSTNKAKGPDAALLKKTLLDKETGYVSHPSVTSGPYVLTSYDGKTAEFTLNPLYKGNSEGIKPSIGSLTFVTVDNKDILPKLESGEIDLVNRVSDRETVQAGIAASASAGTGSSADTDGIAMTSYPRSGLSFISFCADHNPALAEKEVRTAFAWCLDRKGLTEAYEDRYGTAVAGWYGVGQWMFSKEQEFIKELPAYEAEEKEAAANAVELLERAGWNLNAEGEPYAAGEDTVRWKKMSDGTMAALEFTLACPESTRIRELLETHLAKPLGEAGILLHIEPVDGTLLLNMYGSGGEHSYDLMYLATNFSVVFDPCDLFRKNGNGVYEWKSSGIGDNDLYEAAAAMERCKPGDVESYCRHWEDFQKRFAEVLPALPVYSNVYFDFYTARLQGYNPAMTTSWAAAAAQAYLSDVPVIDAP